METLLTGEYNNTIDEKGRISFPVKFRQKIEESPLVITQSFDRCLWIFTQEEWESLSSKIMESSSPFDAKNRLVLRRLIAPAQEISLDKAGRLSIPQSLREYANLTKDCVLLGIDKYIELWDSAEYEKYLSESEDSFIDAAQGLTSIKF